MLVACTGLHLGNETGVASRGCPEHAEVQLSPGFSAPVDLEGGVSGSGSEWSGREWEWE
jgi:hypothetical protein